MWLLSVMMYFALPKLSFSCSLSVIASSSEPYAETVYFSGISAGSISSCNINISAGQNLLDDMGRPWSLMSAISVGAERQCFLDIAFSTSINSIQNAFESDRKRDASEICPSGSVCCTDSEGEDRVRTLSRNDTVYSIHRALSVSLRCTFVLNPTFANIQWRALLQDQADFELNSSALLCRETPPAGECFFVPFKYLNNSTLGITDAYYRNISQLCLRPVGSVLSVDPLRYSGSSAQWDQLGSFRPVRTLHAAQTVEMLNSSKASYQDGRMITFFNVAISNARVAPNFYRAYIDNVTVHQDLSGVHVHTWVLFPNTTNSSTGNQTFSVNIQNCAFRVDGGEIELATNATVTPGHEPVLFLLTLPLFKTGGSCTLILSSFQWVQDWRTVNIPPPANMSTRTTDTETCTAPLWYNPTTKVCEYWALGQPNSEVTWPGIPSNETIFPIQDDSFNASPSTVPLPANPPISSGPSTMTLVIVLVSLILAGILGFAVLTCVLRARKAKSSRKKYQLYYQSIAQQLMETEERSATRIPSAIEGEFEFQFNLKRSKRPQ